ncbi:hypothetical protein OIU35_32745 [Boseaceae bacterium BT-24-1]|nr:hypothetical protein [Boseaceae bacterium BT-24-1]
MKPTRLFFGAALCSCAFGASVAAKPVEAPGWWDILWSGLTRIYDNPPAMVIAVPLSSGRCAMDIGNCNAVAEAACQAEKYRSGRPLETITYKACTGIPAYLSGADRCKLKHRVHIALCWQ